MRDDFSKQTINTLADRAGNRCSNPGCRQPTSGPRTETDKTVNVGVAAHITAASPGGPRYDPDLTSEERRHPDNGIWLCQICAKLVDNDPLAYSADLLGEWKRQAEDAARRALERRAPADGGRGAADNGGDTPPPLADPDLAAVRDLLLAAFTAPDLRRLFLYTGDSRLRPLVREFSPSDGLATMADKVIEFCQVRDLLPDLLREVEQANPRQYARFQGRLYPE